MGNLSIFESQIENHYAYKKTMYLTMFLQNGLFGTFYHFEPFNIFFMKLLFCKWSCLSWSDKDFDKRISIPCPVFDLWRLSCEAFCRLSVICLLNVYSRHHNFIFNQFILWQKLFKMIRKIFWKNIFIVSCPIFTYDVI